MIDPKSMSISYQLAHVAYRARGLANAALASGAPPDAETLRLARSSRPRSSPSRRGASHVDVRTITVSCTLQRVEGLSGEI